MTEKPHRYLTSRLVLWISFWMMVLLLGVKVSTGWDVKSLSLLAGALHTLIICSSLLFSWLMVASRDRPAGESIYGHSKRETALVLLLAIGLGFACIALLWLCIQQLNAVFQWENLLFPIRVTPPLLQLIGLLVAATLGLGLLNRVQGRILKHPLLRFSANQLFKEAGFTALVAGSLAGVWYGEPLFDILLAAIMIVLAADSFWHIIGRQFPLLVEQTAIAPETIEQLVCEIEGILSCDNIQSKGLVGRLVYISMNLHLDPKAREQTPQIARQIEKVLRERYGSVQVTFTIEH